MSYWSDPERRRVALERQAATRAELGPRLERSKSIRRDTLPPSSGGVRRRVTLGKDHPTRDSE